jgi:hypothetical protein
MVVTVHLLAQFSMSIRRASLGTLLKQPFVVQTQHRVDQQEPRVALEKVFAVEIATKNAAQQAELADNALQIVSFAHHLLRMSAAPQIEHANSSLAHSDARWYK